MIAPQGPTALEAAEGPFEQRRLAQLWSFGVLDSPREQIFDELTTTAARLNHAAIAAIILVDTDRLWIKAAVGLEATELARRDSFCDAVVATRAALAVFDARIDPRFSDCQMVAGPPWARSYLGAPLISEAGIVLGTLCLLDTSPRSWRDDDREILELLARQVAAQLELRKAKLAMVNLREEYHRVVEDHQHMLQRAQRRWGAALREGLAQELAGMSYLVQATMSHCRDEGVVIELNDVRQLMNGSMKHCLQIAQGLSESDEVELYEALARQVATTQAETGISCKLQWKMPLGIKGRLVSHVLLEIAQEAIRNAVRHAHCRQIEVTCAEGDGFIVLDVADDGCGLPLDVPLVEGVGITFMRFRAQALGARLQLLPRTAQGLMVRCLAPSSCVRTPGTDSH